MAPSVRGETKVHREMTLKIKAQMGPTLRQLMTLAPMRDLSGSSSGPSNAQGHLWLVPMWPRTS